MYNQEALLACGEVFGCCEKYVAMVKKFPRQIGYIK
jgi:hypothetical protein